MEGEVLGGRSSLDDPDVSKQVKRHTKDVASLKRIIDEYAVANDALKNFGGQSRISAVRMMLGAVSLNKVLLLCGVSKKGWYYTPKIRNVSPDSSIGDSSKDLPRKTQVRHATYGSPGLQKVAPSGKLQDNTVHIQDAGCSKSTRAKWEIIEPIRNPRIQRYPTCSGSLTCPTYDAAWMVGVTVPT